MIKRKTTQPPEVYTSPVLERFMARENPTRQRRLEKLMELGERIYQGVKAKYGDKHGALKEFADAIGKNQSEISKWVSGRHNFTTQLLFDIEEHLEIVLIATEAPAKAKEQIKYIPIVVPASSTGQQIAMLQEGIEDWPASQSFKLQGIYTVKICEKYQSNHTIAGSMYG